MPISNEWSLAVRMLVKRPQESLSTQYLIDSNWQKEAWHSRPDFNRAAEQHFHLCRMLKHKELAVAWAPEEYVMALDSLYVRDPCLITPAGAITCLLRKTARIGEPGEISEYLDQLGIRLLGEIEDPGMMSGGDCVWLDKTSLLVAISEHTNIEGIEQLRSLFKVELPDVEIITVDMTETNKVILDDPEKYKVRTHLHSAVSPVGDKKLVICPERVPESLIAELKKRNWDMLAVTLDQWNEFGAEIFMLKATKGYLGGGKDLEVIRELVYSKWNIKLEIVNISELCRGRGGLKSIILPFIREE